MTIGRPVGSDAHPTALGSITGIFLGGLPLGVGTDTELVLAVAVVIFCSRSKCGATRYPTG